MKTPLRTWSYRAAVFLSLGFVVAPLVAVVWVSVFSNKVISFPPLGYTFGWYVNAWELVDFREGFWLSLQVALVATGLGLLIGVPASLALARAEFPGKAFVNTLLLSPMMVPAIVAGSGVYIYFIQIELFTGIQLVATLPGLIIAHVVIVIPWVVRLVTTSLLSANESIEEAAQNLGATPLTTFWRITLPIARPGLVAGALFSFIVSFTDLEKSLFLVGPGRTTLPIAILNYLEWNLDPTVAAVATVQIFLIGFALIVSDRYVKLSNAF
ncbi:ABC transporter permease [Castellaniella sp. GW247-6E4]|uniref:ABC transporter permease n=1 Tax=Castellaniella sp. GW247-6E4 TaxID=3140380 RepID=UPI003315DAEE